MAKVQRFEDFKVWKNARKAVNRIFDVTDKGFFVRDFGFKNQVRDAGISIMSNIGEGYERDGDKEFIQFLSYAKGSAGEVRSQLYIALDRGYITQKEFDEIYDILIQESKMLRGFIEYLKKSNYTGKKYKK
jgi:four helix bundle protein